MSERISRSAGGSPSKATMFLAPLFLIASALGVLIPLVLHFMQNKRKVTLPFPTLRFLKAAQKRSSSRTRLENILLWLIRTLIMLLLGFAFSMPIIKTSGLGWFGDTPRDVAIILDASYSMAYKNGDAEVWDHAIEAARTIIEGLKEKDRFCIFIARDQPEALIAEPIANKQEGLARLKTITLGDGSSQIASAVDAASQALKKSQSGYEKEIHIITDNQALPWQGFAHVKTDEAASATSKSVVEQGTSVFVLMLGVSNPENTAPLSVTMEPAIVRKGSSAKIKVTSTRTGPPMSSAMTLFVDGKETARRSVTVPDPATSIGEFNLAPLGVGIHEARIEMPDDNLLIDNKFYFLIDVQERRPSLIVGSASDTLFVRTALVSNFSGLVAMETVSPDQLSGKKLTDYSSVILCNALPLSGQAIGLVESYVKAGGLLIVFPGTKATPEDYKAWVCLPGIPAAANLVPPTESKTTLSWDKPLHPLVRPMQEGLGAAELSVRRKFSWEKINESSTVLISMGAKQPFLLERTYGSGKVLMFGISAERTWSNFPLSPFFLPLVLQCTEYGSREKPPFIFSTDSLVLGDYFSDLKGMPSMTNPDGKPVQIRSTADGGRASLIATDLKKPGIYSFAATADSKAQPAFAVNLSRNESNLSTINEEEIKALMGVEALHVATDLASFAKKTQENRVGKTYGEQLLWLVLLLVVIEFVYANKLARRGRDAAINLKADFAGNLNHLKEAAAET